MSNFVGEKIFSLRHQKGRKYSAQELATLIGKTTTTIYHYEKGKVLPDFPTLKKLADFFNVPLKEITGDTYEGVNVDDILQNKEDNDNQSKATNPTDLSLIDELKKEVEYLREKLDEANSTIKQLVSIMANGVGKLEGNTVPSYYVHNLAQSALLVD